MSASSIISGCITGMVPLITITLSGVLLTTWNVFNKSSNDIISKSYAVFFFPLFCLFNLAKFVDIEKMGELWILFVSPSITIVFSALIALAFIPFVKPPKNLTFTTVCMISLPNMANIPLLIINGLCSSYGYLGDEDDCKQANGYVAILALTFNVYMWVGGLTLMQLDAIGKEKSKRTEELREQEEIKESDIIKEPLTFKAILAKSLIAPIPITSFIGLVLGFIPGIKWMFFDNSAPLLSVSDSAFSIAYTGIVLSQMILGSNIVLCWSDIKEISKRYAISTTIIRNLIIPCAALWYSYLLWWLGIFGNNRVMAYINFIAASCPSAIGVLIICQIYDVGVKECTLLMAIQYITGFFTLTIFTYLFFMLI